MTWLYSPSFLLSLQLQYPSYIIQLFILSVPCLCVCVDACLLLALPLARQELAATKLREHPTLPFDEAMETVDMGELWPSVFCAFRGCGWQDAHGGEDALAMHLMDDHSEDLLPIANCMLRGNAPDACLSIYNAAISCKCRNQARGWMFH